MTPKVRQYLIRNEMNIGQQYDLKGMKTLYIGIMSQGDLITEPRVSDKTLSNNLTDWSNMDDGWLVKEGEGKSATFTKVCITRSHLTFKQVHDKAMELLDWGKKFCKR